MITERPSYFSPSYRVGKGTPVIAAYQDLPTMEVTGQQFALLRRQATEYRKGWSISPRRGLFGCNGWGHNLPEQERQYFLDSFWEELTDRVLWVRPCGGRIRLDGSYIVIPAWGEIVLCFVEVAAHELDERTSVPA